MSSGVGPYVVPAPINTSGSASVLETVITADETPSVNIGAAVLANIETYNGFIPGPALRLNVDDTVIVRLINLLDHPTGIHWHGIELSNSADGTEVTQEPVVASFPAAPPAPAGGTYLYKFKVPRPGVYWYHPHHHLSTNRVFRGLYGMIIVADPNEAALIATSVIPGSADTLPLVLSDITVCKTTNDVATYVDPTTVIPASDAAEWLSGSTFQPAPTPVNLCEVGAGGATNDDGSPAAVSYPSGAVPSIIRPAGRANCMAFKSDQILQAARNAPSSLLAVGMMAPVSLLFLYLWGSTPSAGTPDSPFASQLARPAAFLVAWMLMTAAMMLPSSMPLLVSLDRIARHSNKHQTPAFAALAYLGVWEIVGIGVWIVSAAADSWLLPRASGQVVSWLAGGCLILTGLYGLSPLASACLRACRRPFGFLARYWRGGSGASWQAARIGAAYGISCVGCCVPMIGLMFVVGMANIAITIGMGVLMAVMKTSIAGTRIAQLLAVALVGIGVAVGLGWIPLVPHHH
jgi:predicted metal-binding membrane protein